RDTSLSACGFFAPLPFGGLITTSQAAGGCYFLITSRRRADMNQIISTLNQLVSILEKGITINVKVEGLSGAATMESTQQQVIGNLIKEALEASSQQTSLTSSPSETQKDETVLVTESSSLPVEEVVAEPQECPAVRSEEHTSELQSRENLV